MKKALGIAITGIWVTLFFYLFNLWMPKGVLYVVVSIPVILSTSLFILRRSGFEM
ncbi:hypothetical protein HF072_04945 [Bacillus sp. RO3]|nr:hypothetical protein [Bacillus sp. RO3]